MPNAIDAIYDNGVFRPLAPVKGLKSQQRVRITLEKSSAKKHPLSDLCGILPDKDAVEIAKIVEDEFEKVDMNEW